MYNSTQRYKLKGIRSSHATRSIPSMKLAFTYRIAMRKSRIAQENETVIEGTPVGVASMGEVVKSGYRV